MINTSEFLEIDDFEKTIIDFGKFLNYSKSK